MPNHVLGGNWQKELGPKEFDDQGPSKDSGSNASYIKEFVEYWQNSVHGWWIFCCKRDLGNERKRVFGQSLVKVRGCGWFVLVPGKYIDEYFAEK